MTPAGRRLRAALAAVLVQAEAPELALVHRWLDNWRGVGLLAIGLHRSGYDLDLRQYGDGSLARDVLRHRHRPFDSRRLRVGAYGVASRPASGLGCPPARRAPPVSATRRVCGLCGRPFASVIPPGDEEQERDRLCVECLRLPRGA
jgi:hypothetical protein